MSSITRVLAIALVFIACVPTASFAIPSPEIIVGSLSSLSQLFALASGLFGGAAVIGLGVRRGRSGMPRHLAVVAIALLCVSGGLNVYQYMDAAAVKRARLEATLARPSRTPGMPVTDPTLKEISYKEQISHPRGISTQESERLQHQVARGEASDVVFIDVRENAETTMGTLKNARVVRWADIELQKFKAQVEGKRAILFCHNGNRSSETCAALAALGIDCRFVVGGLEKWLVEGREMAGLEGRSLETLRAIPSYPRDKVLLDTPDVKALVEDEKAYFLDVRYPGEFAAGHLPDAINITMRTTPTDVLRARIGDLPRRPVIVPCYDRRSCFFGEVIGLELTQAGHDFRGRYTVPWEYFTEGARPPHVVAWQEEAQRTLWTKAVAGLALALQWMVDRTGFLVGVLILAALSRLIVLPVSLKAERDQAAMRALSGEFSTLRERLREDPARRARAIRAFYKRHGLTPARNLIALLFLPLLTLCVSAVQEVAGRDAGGVLWLGQVAERDPYFLLPIAFGALVAAYLHVAFARTGRSIAAAWLIGFPAFAAVAALLSAAANIYMIASMVFLFGQRWLVQQPWRAYARARRASAAVVDLSHAGERQDCGNKAYRLGKLIEMGVPVPRGVVLTSAFLDRYAAMSPQEQCDQLEGVWRRVGADRVAVRSSAAGEDGEQHSFAGVFDSVLHVGREAFGDALDKVIASFSTERASSYVRGAGAPNVIVQAMVKADHAGVLFTRHPSCAGSSLIEMVEGTAEDLVSGLAAPKGYTFGRLSGAIQSGGEPPMDLQPLLAIGRKAEAAFGAPQDIEWTYCEGAFRIVQSRDVTSLLDSPVEQERDRVLALAAGVEVDEIVFAQTGMSEVLPRPTPLSLSLMQEIWAPGGSVDLACRSLGVTYNADEESRDYLVPVYGRLYVDMREERARAVRFSAAAARRLARSADRIAQGYALDFLPVFDARMSVLEVADFHAMTTDRLQWTLEDLRRSFILQTYPVADAINIAGAFYLAQASKLLAQAGEDAAAVFAGAAQPRVSALVGQALTGDPETRDALLARAIGHRAAFDYELACPRYSETPESFSLVAQAFAPAHPHTRSLATLPRKTLEAVQRALQFQTLKEDAKHEAARELAVIRHIVLALSQRLGLGDLVFQLTLDELATLMPGEAKGRAAARKAAAAALAKAPSLPASLTVAHLETLGGAAQQAGEAKPGALKGARVAGSRAVTGRALVVADDDFADAVERLQDGDILVTSMVSPAWLPYFSRLGGVAAEVGGWLSHTAILAREHDLTMIVGLSGLANVKDGSVISLELDGSLHLPRGADKGMIAAE